MKHGIETATKFSRVSDEIRAQHKGFSEWDSVSSPHGHQKIVQILIDGRDRNAFDAEGFPLPTVVYLSREKRPNYLHNFKAGSMNALVRVSSNISDAPIILNVDCGMYVKVGLKHNCIAEDVITGMLIQCRGWKSAFFNPAREGFLGQAAITLDQVLVQQKRWSESEFETMLTKYRPLAYGIGRMKLGLQMGYSAYSLWTPSSIPTLYFLIVPPLRLLISLYPKPMEFGTSSPMFTIIATFAMLNLFSVMGGLKRVITDPEVLAFQALFLQVLISLIVIMINLNVYEVMFFRRDKGRMPISITIKSTILAISLCIISLY